MNPMNTAQVFMIKNQFNRLGISLPEPVETAITNWQNAPRGVPMPDGWQEAAAAALVEGRDPLDLEPVRRAAAARVINEHAAGIEDLLATAAANTVAEHLDAILDAINTAFSRPLALAVIAYDKLNGADLSNAEAILASGPEAGQHWRDAQELERMIPLVVEAWRSATGIHDGHSVFIWSNPTREQLDEKITQWNTATTFWRTRQAGVTEYGLATPDEFRQRMANLEAAREQHRRRLEAEKKKQRDKMRLA